MKSISLISKLDKLTDDEFREYYENVHSLEAMKFFPFRIYKRNYPISAYKSLDFDCISEFEFNDDLGFKNAMKSGSRERMKDDELRFMKLDKIRFCRVEVHVLRESSEAREEYASRRYVLLFKDSIRNSGRFREQVISDSRAFLDKHPEVRSCSLDIVEPIAGNDFPFDACLWLSYPEGASLCFSEVRNFSGLVSPVQVTTHRSEEEVLKYRFKGYVPAV